MFDDWQTHEVTQTVRAVLAKKRQERKDKWETGDHLELAKDVVMLQSAADLGICNGYKFIQELDYETLKGELEDDPD
jgi:hypothetical protein